MIILPDDPLLAADVQRGEKADQVRSEWRVVSGPWCTGWLRCFHTLLRCAANRRLAHDIRSAVMQEPHLKVADKLALVTELEATRRLECADRRGLDIFTGTELLHLPPV